MPDKKAGRASSVREVGLPAFLLQEGGKATHGEVAARIEAIRKALGSILEGLNFALEGHIPVRLTPLGLGQEGETFVAEANIALGGLVLTIAFCARAASFLATEGRVQIGGKEEGPIPPKKRCVYLGFLISKLFALRGPLDVLQVVLEDIHDPPKSEAGGVVEITKLMLATPDDTATSQGTLRISAEEHAVCVWGGQIEESRQLQQARRGSEEFGSTRRTRLKLQLCMQVELSKLYACVSAGAGRMTLTADDECLFYSLTISQAIKNHRVRLRCIGEVPFLRFLLVEIGESFMRNIQAEHAVDLLHGNSFFLETVLSAEVVIGNLEISIEQLLTLSPGQTFEYRHSEAALIRLRIGNECVAEGRFVTDAQRTLLEIVTIPPDVRKAENAEFEKHFEK